MDERSTTETGLTPQQTEELQRQYDALQRRLESRWKQLTELGSGSAAASRSAGLRSDKGLLARLLEYRADLYFVLLLALFVVHVALELRLTSPSRPAAEQAQEQSSPFAASRPDESGGGGAPTDRQVAASRPADAAISRRPADWSAEWRQLSGTPAAVRPCFETLVALEVGSQITNSQISRARRTLETLGRDEIDSDWSRRVCFQAAAGEVLGTTIRVDGQPISQPTATHLEAVLAKLDLRAADFTLAADDASLQAAVAISWLRR